MCGSVLGDLREAYLTDTLLGRRMGDEWQVTSHSSSVTRHAPGEDLRAQLYQLYGDGQIGEEVFTALRALADCGQLRPADLAAHRARARRCLAGSDDAAVADALRGIRSRLVQLTQSRATSEKVLAGLEARRLELGERIAGKEQAARDTLGRDESVARQRLAEKAELAHSRDRLAVQAQALRADLARLDDLCMQLEAKAAELEAVQARNGLSVEVLK